MSRMAPSTSPVMKSNLHWCSPDWLPFRQRMRDLSGPVALAAVSRRPCGASGPGTRDTEARKRAACGVVLEEDQVSWQRVLTPPWELSFLTRSSCHCSCRSAHCR